MNYTMKILKSTVVEDGRFIPTLLILIDATANDSVFSDIMTKQQADLAKFIFYEGEPMGLKFYGREVGEEHWNWKFIRKLQDFLYDCVIDMDYD